MLAFLKYMRAVVAEIEDLINESQEVGELLAGMVIFVGLFVFVGGLFLTFYCILKYL